MDEKWTVRISKAAVKQGKKLPQNIREKLLNLIAALVLRGPVLPTFLNYGMLSRTKGLFHCHLKKGRPTYVAVWTVLNRKEKVLEITYVGTHEKAPY